MVNVIYKKYSITMFEKASPQRVYDFHFVKVKSLKQYTTIFYGILILCEGHINLSSITLHYIKMSHYVSIKRCFYFFIINAIRCVHQIDIITNKKERRMDHDSLLIHNLMFYEPFLLVLINGWPFKKTLQKSLSLYSPWLTLFSMLCHSKAEHTFASITMSSWSLVNHFAIHVNVERMREIQAKHK